MKIGILTWLHNYNYGSMLQAYALKEFLMMNNYDVKNIDYYPSITEKLKNFMKNRNSSHFIFEKINNMKMEKEFSKNVKLRNDVFDIFLSENFILTNRINKNKELKFLENFDKYICGSDQIWSPNLFNENFYFSFIENKDKISYAPSFGVSIIESKSKEKKITKLLNDFKHISVRENSGKKILNNLGFNDVEVVLDPVFLLSEDKWLKLIKKANISYDKKFICCYFLSFNQDYFDKISNFAIEKNLEIIWIYSDYMSYKINKSLDGIGPSEWLWLIYNCEYVMTDSFHATVFATIFKKKFYCFKRFSDNSKKSQNSRLYNILSLLNLEDRMIDQIPSNDLVYNEQNFKKMNDAIDYSKKWLLNAIK